MSKQITSLSKANFAERETLLFLMFNYCTQNRNGFQFIISPRLLQLKWRTSIVEIIKGKKMISGVAKALAGLK